MKTFFAPTKLFLFLFSLTQKEIMPLSRFLCCCNILTGKGPSWKVTRHSVGGNEKARPSWTWKWCVTNTPLLSAQLNFFWSPSSSHYVSVTQGVKILRFITPCKKHESGCSWMAQQNEIKSLKSRFIFPIKCYSMDCLLFLWNALDIDGFTCLSA